MPRVQPLDASDAPEQVQHLYTAIEKIYGKMLEPVSVTAHNPEVLNAYLAFERDIRKADALDPKLKELAGLRTATLIGCPFCLDIGSKESLDAGVRPEQIQELHAHETSAAFTEEERLVLDYAVAMSQTPQDVSDALFERLQSRFSAPELVELTATIAWENYRSRFNHAMGIKSHGLAENGVCALPAR